MRPSPRRRAVTLVALGLLVVFGSGFGSCGPTTPTPAPLAPHGEPGAGPVIAPLTCPVRGATYTTSFGPRGTGYHYGIDMFVPQWTSALAVRGGTVRYVLNEGGGGNVAYLSADDGNVYMYAHLFDFAGGVSRRVVAGELIGRTGMTGNATAPHLHFEIRIGGVNGTRVDPYQTLRANSC